MTVVWALQYSDLKEAALTAKHLCELNGAEGFGEGARTGFGL